MSEGDTSRGDAGIFSRKLGVRFLGRDGRDGRDGVTGRRVIAPLMALRFVLLLVQSGACVSSTIGPSDDGRVQTGTWGGENLALTVTEAGAHAEFDCAFGDITQPLTVDPHGRLAVDGVFVREHGGPIREGEKADFKPARYSGRIVGRTMTLDVTLTGSNEVMGTFTVTHGAEPRVRKCL